MKEPMELVESLFDIRAQFKTDPEVVELISKLKSKVKELEANTFSEDEIVSEEFEEAKDMYYQELRGFDPEDFSVFDVLWI